MNQHVVQNLKELPKTTDFDSVRISIASPDHILNWSYGEVTKPETINYRTQKPERDGLFDERIFGPTKDWECYCGKYKKIRYKGVICDKCGVEVTRSSVRRERMGHIDLAVPVSHIWYLRGVPSILSSVLDMSVADLEKVAYFAGLIILEVNEEIRRESIQRLEQEYKEAQLTISELQKVQLDALYKETKQEIEQLTAKKVISESRYHDISLKYGQIIRVGIGAEAIHELLTKIDLDKMIEELTVKAQNSEGVSRRKHVKRLRALTDMSKAGIHPSWLLITRLPVIPPDLRPMVQLDGGRFAASDLNDLYRRVLNRNNRLRRLIGQGAPEVIQRNEKRMLQEAIDALIDNSARRGRGATATTTSRKLRSLSDMLRGKQGRFRQNLLGKRVDYSGRSVIVIGPELKLHQCGLPKVMALELFKPFVISRLIGDGHVHNVKNATRMIERGASEVWDILEDVTSEYYVMLNRAPTLHRLGIQAFQPVLIEGKAIQVHPLVCQAFNADFDGDQMAVHVPLSAEARWEVSEIMRSSHNLLKPASGEPIVAPRLDMVWGCYYLTTIGAGLPGEDKIFSGKNEAILAYQSGAVHPRAKIHVRMKNSEGVVERVETSVGRILFNNILPEQMNYRNEQMDSKTLKRLTREIYKHYGNDETAEFVDRVKEVGFEYATWSGMTISMDDIIVPKDKHQIVANTNVAIETLNKQYRRGLITPQERSMKSIELWNGTKSTIEKSMMEGYSRDSAVYTMVTSGARGSVAQLVQMAGMKGLVVNPAGQIIELPVKANYKEGLSVFEYFISSHGARKGRSDGALRTSDAGYLTRRLVDVSQDVVITIEDCGAKEGWLLNTPDSEIMGMTLEERLIGRVAFANIVDPTTKKTIVKKNEEIIEEHAAAIAKAGINEVMVRSVLHCAQDHGICQLCYGRDLATGYLIKLGEAVGIMAAQAIGEPGTQLTMKTFHLGGAVGKDITSGLPRVEEIFESRIPSTPAILAELNGTAMVKEERESRLVRITSTDIKSETYTLVDDYEAIVKSGDEVKAKQSIATAPDKKAIRAAFDGKVRVGKGTVTITSGEAESRDYVVPAVINLRVKDGDKVVIGQEISEGHYDLGQALRLRGVTDLQKYIIREVQEIYSTQGQAINDKHLEIIIRQMLSKVKVLDEGDSEFMVAQLVDRKRMERTNAELTKKKLNPAIAEPVVMGITRVALKTDSFLSAASFQETTSVLIDAAIHGASDNLRGLKENVIIGKLIPAGTGFHAAEKEAAAAAAMAALESAQA
jgi:DNA-directed RNA polymerase subunit beta'